MISIPVKYFSDSFDLVGILSILHSNNKISTTSISDMFWHIFANMHRDVEDGLTILQATSEAISDKIDKEMICINSNFWIKSINTGSLRRAFGNDLTILYRLLSYLENLRPKNVARRDFSLYYELSMVFDRDKEIAKFLGCSVDKYQRESNYFKLNIFNNYNRCNMKYYRMRLSFRYLKDIFENVM